LKEHFKRLRTLLSVTRINIIQKNVGLEAPTTCGRHHVCIFWWPVT